MKKSLPYEILAAVLRLFGAFLLVGVYMPLINPGLTKVETHQELPSAGYYVVLTPIPLALLVGAWYFNRKAQQLKQENTSPREKHSKLKWALFAIVVFLVLYAFLW